MHTRTLWLLATALLPGSPVWGNDAQPVTAKPSELVVPPYVQQVSGDSVAVIWETAQPSFGWVEYGETSELGRRAVRSRHGLLDANVRLHRVILDGIKAGADCHFRVGFKPIKKFAPYSVEFGGEERTGVATLRTLPGPDKPVSAVIYNDLHNRPATLAALQGVVADIDADFTVFNGDCLADPTVARDALAPLAAYVRQVRADQRPALFIRGNHETRGAFARPLLDYFAWPGDRPYFAFTAGPVRWVVLDCGEDKPDEHPAYSGLVDFTSFRRKQTEWLKAEVASSDFRDAPWHVVLHHIPLYPARQDGQGQWDHRKEWANILAAAGVDLAMNGHTHRPAFHPVGAVGNPYAILVGGGPEVEKATMIVVEADHNTLSARLLNSRGEELVPKHVAVRGNR